MKLNSRVGMSAGLVVVIVTILWASRGTKSPPDSKKRNAVGESAFSTVPTGRAAEESSLKPCTDGKDSDDKVQVEFDLPTDPQLLLLRKQLLRPWRELHNEADASSQESAMWDMLQMRNRDAANLLAELLFADKETYFHKTTQEGQVLYSRSYLVMTYLHKMLENSPQPLDGIDYDDQDFPVWRDWWRTNQDKLVFRAPGKPVPLPPGLSTKTD